MVSQLPIIQKCFLNTDTLRLQATFSRATVNEYCSEAHSRKGLLNSFVKVYISLFAQLVFNQYFHDNIKQFD